MLEKIKTLLGIEDFLQDEALQILIDNVTSHLESMLGKEVPFSLNYIIMEVTIRRFNRIGTEGMKSETVEGHRVDFYDLKDEFTPYIDIIEDHKVVKPDVKSKRGRAMFF